jgi:hypothetical protein
LPPNSIPNQIPYRKTFEKQKICKSGENAGGVVQVSEGDKDKPNDDNAAVVINESQITKENYTLDGEYKPKSKYFSLHLML